MLTVVLPAFNEAGTLKAAVDRYGHILTECCDDFEILIVEDASTDDTAAIAAQLAIHSPRVRVISNEANLGQVGSLLRGFAEARGDVVTHNGVDLPFPPEQTGAIVDLMQIGADVVVVERINRAAYGIVRKVVSWVNVFLVKFLFQSPIDDHNFVQAYRRSVLEQISVESRGVSTVTTELILKSIRAGFEVRRLRSDYCERKLGQSSMTVRAVFQSVKELLRLWIIMRRWQCRQASRY